MCPTGAVTKEAALLPEGGLCFEEATGAAAAVKLYPDVVLSRSRGAAAVSCGLLNVLELDGI